MQTMALPEDAQKERFARIDERFDRTDERILGVGKRVAESAKDTDRRFEEVNQRITETSATLDRRITEISAATNKRLENIESEMGLLRHQMAALNVTFNRGSFAIVASVLGVIAAILAKVG
jgi:DNA repair exonuclease SbcCD ATPase subunit